MACFVKCKKKYKICLQLKQDLYSLAWGRLTQIMGWMVGCTSHMGEREAETYDARGWMG
jgi:hypothetical protein